MLHPALDVGLHALLAGNIGDGGGGHDGLLVVLATGAGVAECDNPAKVVGVVSISVLLRRT